MNPARDVHRARRALLDECEIFGGRGEVRRIKRPAGDRSGILAQRFDHLLAIAREDDPRRRLVCLQRGRHHVEGDDAAARMVDDENHSRFVQ